MFEGFFSCGHCYFLSRKKVDHDIPMISCENMFKFRTCRNMQQFVDDAILVIVYKNRICNALL